MKFENFEVEEKYYELLRKYKISHCNFGDTFNEKKMTYDDLCEIENSFIKFAKPLER